MTPPIELSDEDYQTTGLDAFEHMAFRARIILAAFRGHRPGHRPHVGHPRSHVSKWRRRFHKSGLAGLTDQPRSGKPARYTEATVRSMDEAPPPGYANS